jgi:hypothetical protein
LSHTRRRVLTVPDGERRSPYDAVVTEGNPARARLLHAKSEHAYTSRAAEALWPDAGEAVSEDEQREITSQANRAWTARQRAAWAATAEVIGVALDRFEEIVVGDPPLVNSLRAVRRATAVVSRRLASR